MSDTTPTPDTEDTRTNDGGGLTLSRPGETAPQTRRNKRDSAPAPTGKDGIPAGRNGRLRVIHN